MPTGAAGGLWRPPQLCETLMGAAGAQRRLDGLPEVLVGDDERVAGGRARMHQAIADRDVRPFGPVGAEQVIPDQQHAAIVLVEVFGIACVMHAVGGGRVDDPLQPTDAADELGMDEELIGEAD